MNTNTNIIIDGFTSSEKTFLACALGKSACKLGYRTRYIRMLDLFQLYDEAAITISGASKFEWYALLIIDESMISASYLDMLPHMHTGCESSH